MNWRSNGPTAIESGKWRIAKAYLDGCTMYSLHENGGDAIGFSEDVEDLKAMAEERNGSV